MSFNDDYSDNEKRSTNLDDFDDEDISHLHLGVEISDNQYCIPVKLVSEIIQMPRVTILPTEDEYHIGAIKLRDKIIKVTDLRRLLSIESIEEQEEKLFSMLEERKQDHINYVNELIYAVREKREFNLTTDPHLCKFGKWYDIFKTDDISLREYMRKFDSPHKVIHNDAQKIMNYMGLGDYTCAEKLLEDMQKNDLPIMISLFDNFKTEFKKARRLAGVIVEMSQKTCIPVDSVTKIISLDLNKIQQNKSVKSDFIKGFVSQEDETYILLSEICFVT